MKFLIIRFSSIGDIVLTTPVIRCLKKQVPGAEVHFLVKNEFRSTVEHNPYIDKLQVLAHSRELMIEELKNEHYDHIIDLQYNAESMQVKAALKKNSFSYKEPATRQFFLTAFKVNLLPRTHVVDRYMRTVGSFGVKNDGQGLDYFISKQEEIKKQDIPASHSAGYIACVIGADHFTRRWPVHHWKEFCAQLQHPVILLGDEKDNLRGDEIAVVDPIKVYNACGKFKLNECADLIRRAKLVISNDTGLMHIAAAFRRPVISLWGNTVPSFGMTPYYGDTLIPPKGPVENSQLQIPKLWCRPCTRNGYNKCPLGHFNCMEKITASELLERTRQRI